MEVQLYIVDRITLENANYDKALGYRIDNDHSHNRQDILKPHYSFEKDILSYLISVQLIISIINFSLLVFVIFIVCAT